MMKRVVIARSVAICFALFIFACPIFAQVGPLVGTGPLPFVSMPPLIVATNFGTGGSTGGAVTITGSAIPAGSLIVVVVQDNNSSAAGTASDASNTYTAGPTAPTATNTIGAIAYAANVTSVSSVTYTPLVNTGSRVAVSVFYASNVATSSPLDTAVTAGTGSCSNTTTPTTTSGTPSQSYELFVGIIFSYLNAPTISSGAGSFSPPPNSSVSANPAVNGGSFVNTGTGTATFAPTMSVASAGTCDVIIGFKHK